MKKIISIISVLAAAASLTACRENGSSAGNIADNSNVSQSTISSQSSMTSQSTTSSDEPPLSDDPYLDDLKGEDLIAKFEWPYDAQIDIEGMTAKRMDADDNGKYTFNDIQPIDISNTFDWIVYCDYGCLAMTPENGGEYEYKKYKTGDKIGDFTVTDIETTFRNFEHFGGYFAGVTADFAGEITLTGEMGIVEDYTISSELRFYPDKESRKKLPVVNFMPKFGEYFNEGYYSYDNLTIAFGDRTDYPEIDFKGIPEDGTRVKVKLKINKYRYRAECGFPFIGFANIVDASFEVL